MLKLIWNYINPNGFAVLPRSSRPHFISESWLFSLVGNEDLGQFSVTDTLACLGTIPSTMTEKLNLLRASLGLDGVHLKDVGRMHLLLFHCTQTHAV
jgi:hypothetical protein